MDYRQDYTHWKNRTGEREREGEQQRNGNGIFNTSYPLVLARLHRSSISLMSAGLTRFLSNDLLLPIRQQNGKQNKN